MFVRDIIDQAIQSSSEQLLPTLPSTTGLSKLEQQAIDIQNKADIYHHAMRSTSLFGNLTTQAILLMMVEYELEQLYRFKRGTTFNSLEEWALFTFEDHRSEDWVLRYCSSVKRFLIPIEAGGFKDVDGKQITAESVVTKSNMQTIKEIPFAFTNVEPQQQQELLQHIVAGSTNTAVREKADELFQTKKNSKVVIKPRYTFIMRQRDDYKTELSVVVDDKDIKQLQRMFGRNAEFAFDTKGTA
jgi:hypothetical protein